MLARRAIGHHERPAGVRVGPVLLRLDVGDGVGAVTCCHHQTSDIFEAVVFVAFAANEGASEVLISPTRGHELDRGAQSRRRTRCGAIRTGAPVEAGEEHLRSGRHHEIRPTGVERGRVAVDIDVGHDEVIVGHLFADAVLGIHGGGVARRRRHQRVRGKRNVAGVVGLIADSERRGDSERKPPLKLLRREFTALGLDATGQTSRCASRTAERTGEETTTRSTHQHLPQKNIELSAEPADATYEPTLAKADASHNCRAIRHTDCPFPSNSPS